MKKTVLITGASRGIGRAAALLFGSRGYNVVINYLHSEKQAKSVRDEIISSGGRAIICRADVSDRKQVGEMFNAVKQEFGTVDILVNNAGIAQEKQFQDITTEEFRNMLSVNLESVFNCTQIALTDMLKQKSGSIVNVASIWGIRGAACESHYSASKGAVISLTQALAREFAPSGIRINAVAPGATDTDILDMTEIEKTEFAKEIPMKKIGKPEDIASVIFFLATAAQYITGQVIIADGGYL